MQTILIVDDEEGFLHILEVVLQRAGYATETALSAMAALEVLDAQSVDLIILDDMMPGLSGSEMCAKVKSDPLTQHIPVIMHSAGLKIHDKTHIEQIGADAVLVKPCPPRDVVEMVTKFMNAGV
ncbi:MAG: response regulator transcription factor [Chloroflexi bacterium]|nr:response regulator transcription factor [Chloroflexota bacterium]